MSDEADTPLDATAFDEPSVFVGMTETQIRETINRDAEALIALGEPASAAGIRADRAAEAHAALELVADNMERIWLLAMDNHKALLNQTPDSWPEPHKPQYMTEEEHKAFCQKLLDDWKARDPENAPATVEEFMMDCYGNWPSD
jgi:hypothetical protein